MAKIYGVREMTRNLDGDVIVDFTHNHLFTDSDKWHAYVEQCVQSLLKELAAVEASTPTITEDTLKVEVRTPLATTCFIATTAFLNE